METLENGIERNKGRGDFTDEERKEIRDFLLGRKRANDNWVSLGNILKWAGYSGAAIVAAKLMLSDIGAGLKTLLLK